MGCSVKEYLQDGADYQSRAVLMLVQGLLDDAYFGYEKPTVARWSNCREQGYVISTHTFKEKDMHIAFFQHRNSDSIHAVRWEEHYMTNPPTIETADFGDVYKDKFDTSFQVKPHEIEKMSSWIVAQLKEYYKAKE